MDARHHSPLRRGPCLGAVLLAVVGCSLIVGSDDEVQCSVDADCIAPGSEDAVCEANACIRGMSPPATETDVATGASTSLTTSDGVTTTTAGPNTGSTDPTTTSGIDPTDPWGCLGRVEWDEEDENTPARVGLHFTNSTFEAYEGATLQACSPLDLGCDPPLSTGTSDANGDVLVDVYYGFDGYFRAPSPRMNPEFLPFILYIYPPPISVETEVRKSDVLLIDQPTISLLASISGTEIEPETGYVFFTVNDCLGNGAAGVTVTATPIGTSTVTAYLEGSFPNPDLTETDESGQGAIINVPPGLVEVTGVSLEHGKFFERSVLVEPGRITGIPIVPSPL